MENASRRPRRLFTATAIGLFALTSTLNIAASAQAEGPRVADKTIEIGNLSHTPPKVGDGDADFNGNGPRVTASAHLQVRNGTELWVVLSMHAKETKKDYTEVRGSEEFRVYTVEDPRHQTIETIISDQWTQHRYTDTDHADDAFYKGSAELVNEFVFTGDTKGKEAGSRTAMSVSFNPVTIRIQEAIH